MRGPGEGVGGREGAGRRQKDRKGAGGGGKEGAGKGKEGAGRGGHGGSEWYVHSTTKLVSENFIHVYC